MFVKLTQGFFHHSEPVGSGSQIIVRISDIERVEGRDTERWVGEDVSRHVGSRVYLISTRRNGQRLYCDQGVEVRETMEEIYAAIQAAMPTHKAIHDHSVMGAVQIGGSVRHESAGSVQHLHIAQPSLAQ